LSERHTIYLGFGSNLGNRVAALRTGVAVLAEYGVEAEAFSSLYHSSPKYVIDQPPFVNLVGRFRTLLEPGGVMEACHAAEQAAGRQQRERHGPRELDVDLLLFDQQTVDTADLAVPHPAIPERLFVLAPLAEIDPDLEVPGMGTVADLLTRARAELPKEEGVIPLGAFVPERGRPLDGAPGSEG
jgi:2-amino-4-hydroxy-6-hydroxymethyldihydropteridine diphosphokinase